MAVRQHPKDLYAKSYSEDQDDEIHQVQDEPEFIEPPDKFNCVYFIFFLLGLGMLYPWNTFITANEYFSYRFRGTPFSENFQNYFSIGFTLANLLCLVLALKLQRTISVAARVLFAMCLNLAVFLATTAMTKVSDVDGTLFFYITFVLVILAGSATAFFQNSIFGLASEFPPMFTQAVMAGQGFSGLIISTSQIIIILASASSSGNDSDVYENGDVNATNADDDEANTSGQFAYFLVASGVIFLCIISYFVLQKLPLYDFHHLAPRRRRDLAANQSKAGFQNRQAIESDPLLGKGASSYEQLNDDGESSKGVTPGSSSQYNLFVVLRKIYPFALSAFAVFFVTLALFPGTTSRILSTQDQANQGLFISIHFLLFNAGDWIGRTLAGLGAVRRMVASCSSCFFANEQRRSSRRLVDEDDDAAKSQDACCAVESGDDGKIITVDAIDPGSPSRFHPGLIGMLALVRVVFIPFFVLSNVADSVIASPLANDYAFMTGMLVFSVSNGLIGSLAMMAGPERAVGAEKEVAGSIMVLLLTSGLGFGSLLSFGVRSVVCGGCNPFLS